MTDIAVIILVGREKLHIRRCLEKLQQLEPRQIFVIESQPSDGTHEIAVEMGAVTAFNKWPGLQSVQFNWALDNLPIRTKWILRIDADEWLTPELIAEIQGKLLRLDDDIDGVVLKRRHYFGGRWVKRGTYPTRILRLFRTGHARYSDGMVMDEHLVVKGKTIEFDNDFADESLIPFEDWKEKHRGYAKREAQQAIESLKTGVWTDPRKAKYYKLPRYFRGVVYFCYRYFYKLGFLDGIVGFRWHFWQGLWYRWIVDREIGRLVVSR